jgi:hypothetical protein
MSKVMMPYLCGGDLDLRTVRLQEKHYLQDDTSRNADIWALFPVQLFAPHFLVAEGVLVEECKS